MSPPQAPQIKSLLFLYPPRPASPDFPPGSDIHSAILTAGPDVTGRDCLESPPGLPPHHPFDPRLSKRHWQEPGKATPLFQLAERGEMGSRLQVTHAPTPPLESAKPNPKPATNHKQAAPLSVHTLGVQRRSGREGAHDAFLLTCFVLRSLCPVGGVCCSDAASAGLGLGDWATLGTARFIGQPPTQFAPLGSPLPPSLPQVPSPHCSKNSFYCFLDSECGAAVPACRAGYHVTPPGFIPMQDR